MRFRLISAQLRAVGGCTLATLLAVTFAAAQSVAPPASSLRGGASTILGPGMLAPGSGESPCLSGAAGLAKWGVERIQTSLSLTDEQAAKFEALKGASEKAAENLKTACPNNDSVTPTGRLSALELRLEAMLEAVRTIKPALEAFYDSLSDEQKARLTALEQAYAPTGGARLADNTGADENGSPHHPSHHAHLHTRRHEGFRLPFPFAFWNWFRS